MKISPTTVTKLSAVLSFIWRSFSPTVLKHQNERTSENLLFGVWFYSSQITLLSGIFVYDLFTHMSYLYTGKKSDTFYKIKGTYGIYHSQ